MAITVPVRSSSRADTCTAVEPRTDLVAGGRSVPEPFRAAQRWLNKRKIERWVGRTTGEVIDDIITDIIKTKTSERGATRIDDRLSEAAMEDRKLNGYF